MATTTRGTRVEAQLGRLLLRSTRTYLYDQLVTGVDGVDATTYPVLSGLARIGPTTATELAAAIGLDRTATTRYASRLQAAGLLYRVSDDQDRRAIRLELTPAGREAITTMRRTLSQLFDDMLSTWTRNEAEQFATSLERFTAMLEQRR